MLILSRGVGESIRLDDEIQITVLSAIGSQVRIGIEAPKNIDVHRQEIYERIQNQGNKMRSQGKRPVNPS